MTNFWVRNFPSRSNENGYALEIEQEADKLLAAYNFHDGEEMRAADLECLRLA